MDPDAPPLETCSQIVQHTAAQGALQFDLYLKCFFEEPPYGVGSYHVEFEWPEAWSCTGYDVPGITTYPYEGDVTFQLNGNSAEVDAEWGSDWYEYCPMTDAELFLLLRVYMTVDGYGALDWHGTPNQVILCDPEDVSMDPAIYQAVAGVVCDYEDIDCRLYGGCSAAAGTDVLDIQLAQGESTQVELPYYLVHTWGWACTATCGGTEDWMTVSGETDDGHDYTVTLGIDTAGLPPGDYDGWVQVDSEDSRACTRVNLEVLDLTGISSGVSWGRIKALY